MSSSISAVLPRIDHDAHLDLALGTLECEALLDGQQDFTNPEQTNHCDQEIKALEQLCETKGHAQLTRYRIETDRSQGEAQHHRGDRLEW